MNDLEISKHTNATDPEIRQTGLFRRGLRLELSVVTSTSERLVRRRERALDAEVRERDLTMCHDLSGREPTFPRGQYASPIVRSGLVVPFKSGVAETGALAVLDGPPGADKESSAVQRDDPPASRPHSPSAAVGNNDYSKALLAHIQVVGRNGVRKSYKTSQAKELQYCIRILLREIMELGQHDDITEMHYPSEEEVALFAKDKSYIGGPRQRQPVRLDIGREGRGSMVATDWNAEVCVMLYEKLCGTFVRIDHAVPALDVFSKLFRKRVQTLRALVVRQRKSQEAGREKLEREKTLNRMRTEHERRGEGLYINTDIPGVDRHHELYVKLPYEVVSPDQPSFPSPAADSGRPYTERNGSYEVRIPQWRNPDEEAWFRMGALLQMAAHFTDDSEPLKGNFPRQRIRTGRLIDYEMPAPKGLPRNFYSPAWLRQLERSGTEDAQLFLASIGSEFDTTLPEALISRAARFEHVHTRRDRPLGRDDKLRILSSSLFNQIGPNRTIGRSVRG
ncbi:hypothetical protein BD626DRAFT_503111 [Schizophyllum amplum]|uniref:Uncharacterized protein n=1 Tax=Schizophyllum amplum TaxID=97359 RepID=A0A550C7V2_9AGAR|nr:hypothetical protein BD626DRAFT_503111 [Auriculariopsis ampla]